MTSSLNKTIRAAKLGAEYIITPRLNMFLMNNPNLVLDDWVADKIREQLVKQPRVRSGSFSSSAAGMCHRRQVFAFLDIHPDGVNSPQLQQIFYDGTWRHLRWQAVLLQAGLLTDIEFPLKWEAMRSVGTMDGLGVVPDDHANFMWRGCEYGFELKGINTYGFKKAVSDGVKDDHLAQVHRYFLSGGFDLFVIIYEDKNTQEWIEWVVTPEEALLAAQREELRLLNEAVDKKQLPMMRPECASKTGDIWVKGWCPYAGDHGICESATSWPTEGAE
jgi:hypothetical protein